MAGDPIGFFSLLMRVCIRDDPDSKTSSIAAVTAASFLLGIVTSGVTAYLLSFVHI